MKTEPVVGFSSADVYAPIPYLHGAVYLLKAKIDEAYPGLGKKISFPHRHSTRISFGVNFNVPDGYRLRMAITDEFANRGLVFSSSAIVDSDQKAEFKVTVVNAGREIVDLRDQDVLAHCWIEPLHKFTWKKAE